MKTLALIGGSERTARVLSAQLDSYLGDKVQIRSFWINGGISAPVEADIVVLSSALVQEDLQELGYLPAECVLVIGRRTVDPDALERIVALPPETKVLFVNDRPETARECVEAVLELGLTAVHWLPWHPESPPPPAEYLTAAVAGEPGLVPSSISTIIDIGTRILDFGTIAEILSRLDIAYEEIGLFSRRYLAKIVSLARRLSRSNEEARRLSGHLGSVIDSLRHGILVYDAEGRVSVCNDEVKELLAIRGGTAIGSTLPMLIRHKELLEFLECRCGEDDVVFKLPAGSVVVRRFDLAEGGHTVAVFRGEGDEAAEAARLGREYRRRGHVAKWTLQDIVGESEPLRRAKRIAERLAVTDLSILIHGESGTGKELFASAIHAASARANGPFLALDLGALSDELVESELFGYEEGAFTGARKGGKPGFFELANGGSLFLDEIGNVSPKVQTRLLRVLQEKEVMRVGGADIKHVDVRIIAATNEDLLAKAHRGEFREDLYFRLKMGWVRIPSLRERRQDIAALVQRFLQQENVRDLVVEPEVLAELAARDWPGNVRELRNALTYMLAVHEGQSITMADLPDAVYFSTACDDLDAPKSTEKVFAASVAANDSSLVTQPPAADPAAAPALPALGPEGQALALDDQFVLAALAAFHVAGRSAGREAITSWIVEHGRLMGPGSVRASMERLAALGLLDSSRGRRGTCLSLRGRSLFTHFI
ncbi:MAG: sigma 54-interacting transcriptional regulator [Spirochaetes bacterium]|nr:sigma 54-interacting transcriptional regulator [Spirochaetota bacterium]MBU0956657.1 sigma 54-interacting transcriptional regulator [Spirochaetota bacterium]